MPHPGLQHVLDTALLESLEQLVEAVGAEAVGATAGAAAASSEGWRAQLVAALQATHEIGLTSLTLTPTHVSSEEGAHILKARKPREALAPDPRLPEDSRLWAALQNAGGGTWGGCVFDIDRIVEALENGRAER